MQPSIQDVEKIENLIKIGNYDKMYRINHNGSRMYIKESPFMYYSGLTGALTNATFKGNPEEKRLTGWRNSMINSFGEKSTNDYVEMTAEFGTLLHAALVGIQKTGGVVWNEERDKAYECFLAAYNKRRIEPDYRTIRRMTFEYQKHIGSMLQFIYDRVQEIYAIEVPARWEELKIATPIDLFCLCRQTPKGDFSKTTINLKTSSGISNHQFEQVACEFRMWNETYPDDMASNTAILRTVDWSEGKPPTYEYKYLNHLDAHVLSFDAEKRLTICLGSSSSYYPNPINKYFEGETKAGELPLIVFKSLEEEWVEAQKQILQ